MAGTYTQIDPLQGTISVNIRGMNGLGRVNTMVDGVTQTSSAWRQLTTTAGEYRRRSTA